MSKPTELTDHDPIAERARGLPQAVAPDRNLWPEIRREMTAARSWTKTRLATAAVLLIGISSGVTLWFSQQWQPDVSTTAQVRLSQTAQFGPWYSSSTDIMQNRMDMLLILQEELAPETRDILAHNLRNIETARQDINIALQGHPNSELLQQLLLSTYTHELTLLSELRGMTQSARQRTQL